MSYELFKFVHVNNTIVRRNGLGVVLILLFCGTLVAQVKTDVKKTLVSIGMQVPEFKYEVIKGKSSKISELKGKIVLINFFATWCAPCRRELPLVESEIWAKHQSNPKFAMLTFGREHTWKEVEKFKLDMGFKSPFYPDPKREIFDKFATQDIPRSFLLDEEGKIIFMSDGFDENHFKELVNLIESKL
jgi:thiol-disulfide isomerase/thioredoxin